MTIRRFSAAVFAAALLTPGLAACNNSGTGEAGSSASPSVSGSIAPGGATPGTGDAKQALLNSTNEIRNGNFRFTMSGVGSTAEGQVHEPSQSAQMRLTIGDPSSDLMMKLDLIHAKPDSWVKLELGGKSASSIPGAQKLNLGKYQHLDQTRIKGNRALGLRLREGRPGRQRGADPGHHRGPADRRGQYAGTLDVSKAAEAGSVDADGDQRTRRAGAVGAVHREAGPAGPAQ